MTERRAGRSTPPRAARAGLGVTEEEALTRVLDDFERAAPAVDGSAREQRVPIHAIYEGQRTDALFDPASEQVEIVSGELAGRSYRTPSGAAVDVVRLRNAAVTPTGTAGRSGRSPRPATAW